MKIDYYRKLINGEKPQINSEMLSNEFLYKIFKLHNTGKTIQELYKEQHKHLIKDITKHNNFIEDLVMVSIQSEIEKCNYSNNF